MSSTEFFRMTPTLSNGRSEEHRSEEYPEYKALDTMKGEKRNSIKSDSGILGDEAKLLGEAAKTNRRASSSSARFSPNPRADFAGMDDDIRQKDKHDLPRRDESEMTGKQTAYDDIMKTNRGLLESVAKTMQETSKSLDANVEFGETCTSNIDDISHRMDKISFVINADTVERVNACKVDDTKAYLSRATGRVDGKSRKSPRKSADSPRKDYSPRKDSPRTLKHRGLLVSEAHRKQDIVDDVYYDYTLGRSGPARMNSARGVGRKPHTARSGGLDTARSGGPSDHKSYTDSKPVIDKDHFGGYKTSERFAYKTAEDLGLKNSDFTTIKDSEMASKTAEVLDNAKAFSCTYAAEMSSILAKAKAETDSARKMYQTNSASKTSPRKDNFSARSSASSSATTFLWNNSTSATTILDEEARKYETNQQEKKQYHSFLEGNDFIPKKCDFKSRSNPPTGRSNQPTARSNPELTGCTRSMKPSQSNPRTAGTSRDDVRSNLVDEEIPSERPLQFARSRNTSSTTFAHLFPAAQSDDLAVLNDILKPTAGSGSNAERPRWTVFRNKSTSFLDSLDRKYPKTSRELEREGTNDRIVSGRDPERHSSLWTKWDSSRQSKSYNLSKYDTDMLLIGAKHPSFNPPSAGPSPTDDVLIKSMPNVGSYSGKYCCLTSRSTATAQETSGEAYRRKLNENYVNHEKTQSIYGDGDGEGYDKNKEQKQFSPRKFEKRWKQTLGSSFSGLYSATPSSLSVPPTLFMFYRDYSKERGKGGKYRKGGSPAAGRASAANRVSPGDANGDGPEPENGDLVTANANSYGNSSSKGKRSSFNGDDAPSARESAAERGPSRYSKATGSKAASSVTGSYVTAGSYVKAASNSAAAGNSSATGRYQNAHPSGFANSMKRSGNSGLSPEDARKSVFDANNIASRGYVTKNSSDIFADPTSDESNDIKGDILPKVSSPISPTRASRGMENLGLEPVTDQGGLDNIYDWACGAAVSLASQSACKAGNQADKHVGAGNSVNAFISAVPDLGVPYANTGSSYVNMGNGSSSVPHGNGTSYGQNLNSFTIPASVPYTAPKSAYASVYNFLGNMPMSVSRRNVPQEPLKEEELRQKGQDPITTGAQYIQPPTWASVVPQHATPNGSPIGTGAYEQLGAKAAGNNRNSAGNLTSRSCFSHFGGGAKCSSRVSAISEYPMTGRSSQPYYAREPTMAKISNVLYYGSKQTEAQDDENAEPFATSIPNNSSAQQYGYNYKPYVAITDVNSRFEKPGRDRSVGLIGTGTRPNLIFDAYDAATGNFLPYSSRARTHFPYYQVSTSNDYHPIVKESPHRNYSNQCEAARDQNMSSNDIVPAYESPSRRNKQGWLPPDVAAQYGQTDVNSPYRNIQDRDSPMSPGRNGSPNVEGVQQAGNSATKSSPQNRCNSPLRNEPSAYSSQVQFGTTPSSYAAAFIGSGNKPTRIGARAPRGFGRWPVEPTPMPEVASFCGRSSSSRFKYWWQSDNPSAPIAAVSPIGVPTAFANYLESKHGVSSPSPIRNSSPLRNNTGRFGTGGIVSPNPQFSPRRVVQPPQPFPQIEFNDHQREEEENERMRVKPTRAETFVSRFGSPLGATKMGTPIEFQARVTNPIGGRYDTSEMHAKRIFGNFRGDYNSPVRDRFLPVSQQVVANVLNNGTEGQREDERIRYGVYSPKTSSVIIRQDREQWANSFNASPSRGASANSPARVVSCGTNNAFKAPNPFRMSPNTVDKVNMGVRSMEGRGIESPVINSGPPNNGNAGSSDVNSRPYMNSVQQSEVVIKDNSISASFMKNSKFLRHPNFIPEKSFLADLESAVQDNGSARVQTGLGFYKEMAKVRQRSIGARELATARHWNRLIPESPSQVVMRKSRTPSPRTSPRDNKPEPISPRKSNYYGVEFDQKILHPTLNTRAYNFANYREMNSPPKWSPQKYNNDTSLLQRLTRDNQSNSKLNYVNKAWQHTSRSNNNLQYTSRSDDLSRANNYTSRSHTQNDDLSRGNSALTMADSKLNANTYGALNAGGMRETSHLSHRRQKSTEALINSSFITTRSPGIGAGGVSGNYLEEKCGSLSPSRSYNTALGTMAVSKHIYSSSPQMKEVNQSMRQSPDHPVQKLTHRRANSRPGMGQAVVTNNSNYAVEKLWPS